MYHSMCCHQESTSASQSQSSFWHPNNNVPWSKTYDTWHQGDQQQALLYQAAVCTVPLFPRKYCQIAKLFKVVFSLKRSVTRNQAMQDTLVKTTLELFLDSEADGSRSPLHVDDIDDSFELDNNAMADMATLLSQPEHEQLDKFNEALAKFEGSCIGETLASQEEIKTMYSKIPTLQEISSQLDDVFAMVE
ncbi:hypothetical protein K492DRAFT_234329 [Lichtheimia hyalospora FSU 10163]|nr:hypothetical protein K492DRAFT_234329 [Lichtheimia hyalospora FSU 10163]